MKAPPALNIGRALHCHLGRKAPSGRVVPNGFGDAAGARDHKPLTSPASAARRGGDPGDNQHNPQYADYWAPLTRKRHIPPHPAQPRHTNDGAPRTRKRHQREEFVVLWLQQSSKTPGQPVHVRFAWDSLMSGTRAFGA